MSCTKGCIKIDTINIFPDIYRFCVSAMDSLRRRQLRQIGNDANNRVATNVAAHKCNGDVNIYLLFSKID